MEIEKIKSEYGVWYDASRYVPTDDGFYIVALESKSSVVNYQDYTGSGEAGIIKYNSSNGWQHDVNLRVSYWSKPTYFPLFLIKHEGQPSHFSFFKRSDILFSEKINIHYIVKAIAMDSSNFGCIEEYDSFVEDITKKCKEEFGETWDPADIKNVRETIALNMCSFEI